MLIPNVDSCHGRLSGVSFDLLLSFTIGFTIGRLLKEASDLGYWPNGVKKEFLRKGSSIEGSMVSVSLI